jgi:hypothetical protein
VPVPDCRILALGNFVEQGKLSANSPRSFQADPSDGCLVLRRGPAGPNPPGPSHLLWGISQAWGTMLGSAWTRKNFWNWFDHWFMS